MCSIFFFFNDTATTEIYTLSLHDALPISLCVQLRRRRPGSGPSARPPGRARGSGWLRRRGSPARRPAGWLSGRSEEHTSELQSPCNLVCRLLLEKKKKYKHPIPTICTREQ